MQNVGVGAEQRVLAVDVGGSRVKLLLQSEVEPRRFDSGPELTPQQTVDGTVAAAAGWSWDVASVGIPTPVRGGKPAAEPANLGKGWIGFDFEQAFGRPTKVVNDAVMQALGSYERGRMLFLGLGTGLGSALIIDGVIEPLELAHLPFRKGTFEDYVGERSLLSRGKKRWRKLVFEVVEQLDKAMQPDYIVIGGGGVKHLDELPPNCRRGDNGLAFLGGFRLWDPAWTPSTTAGSELSQS
jgi:polyphosphate glucokinase